MKNPSNSSEQALEDYFRDLLLNEPAPAKGGDAAPFKATVVDAFGSRSTSTTRLLRATDTPPTASLPLRALNESRSPIDPRPSIETRPLIEPRISAELRAHSETRAYAEPIKTLNLRMPLPPLAPAPAVAPVQAPAPVIAVPLPTPVPVDKAPVPIETPEPLPVATAPMIEAELPAKIEEVDANAPAAWLDNGRPAWAQRPFECLLFKVGGLALAAPLAELGSIYPLEEDMLTSIFGQAAWFMGLLPTKGYNVRTIDAAQVVMPERYSESMREDYRYVITLHGSDWGLAVDSVANSVILQPDQVRWRGQRSKRPWLAGTVVTQMCALLDVAQLIWMFQNQDGKRILPHA